MNENNIVNPENIVYKKPKLMNDNYMHYCPGCSHGVVHKIIAEVIEELGLEEKTIGIAPVGCAVFAYNYIDIDWVKQPRKGSGSSYSHQKAESDKWFLLIKAMAIWQPLELPRPFTRAIEVRILRLSSLIMLFMA